MDHGDHMRVDITRSGGFAGLSQVWAADTSQLDSELASELRTLVDALLAAAHSIEPPVRMRGADRFSYDVRVACGDDLVRLNFSGSSPLDSFLTLFNWMLDHAPLRRMGPKDNPTGADP